MLSQYGELRSTNSWDRFGSLGHQANFSWFHVLASLYPVYTIQPVVKPVSQPVSQPVWKQVVSCKLGFTAPTSLSGDQPNFARCLAVSWAGTLCTHFTGSCPLTEFCQVQTSLCVQVLHSPTCILAVLLHGSRAVGVSETLRRGTRNGITELSQTVPPICPGGQGVGHRPTFLVVFSFFITFFSGSARQTKLAICLSFWRT